MVVIRELATRKEPFGNARAAVEHYEEACAALNELIDSANVVAIADQDGLLDDEIVQRLRDAVARALGGAK
jgi:ribosomal protein L10